MAAWSDIFKKRGITKHLPYETQHAIVVPCHDLRHVCGLLQ
jgi:hypothetical protein